MQKLLDKIEKEWEQWLKACRYFLGDKGYDSTKIINRLERREMGRMSELEGTHNIPVCNKQSLYPLNKAPHTVNTL